MVYIELYINLKAGYIDLSVAGDQRVASEAVHTAADGPVVPHLAWIRLYLSKILDKMKLDCYLALGVLAAGSDAGVLAVVVEAGEAGGALPVILTVALPVPGSYTVTILAVSTITCTARRGPPCTRLDTCRWRCPLWARSPRPGRRGSGHKGQASPYSP